MALIRMLQAITARAMNGELDFGSSLRARVTLLKGVPADVFERLKSVITVTPGARELCKSLNRLGYKLAVLSGGFTPLAQWLADDLGIDYAFANNVCSLEHLLSLACISHCAPVPATPRTTGKLGKSD
jgi:phosphoserine phosphatase